MDPASLLRLLLLSAIWGGSFLFMRIGVPVFGPAMLIGLRLAFAAAFLWGVSRLWSRPLKPRGRWGYFLVVGLFNSALPFLLFAYAAQSLTAALLGILNATAPMFGALFTALWQGRPVTRQAAMGLALGLAGVALVAGDARLVKGDGWWLAVLATLAAAACYGLVSTYIRGVAAGESGPVDPFDTAHGSMWVGSALTLPLALAFPARLPPQAGDWAALAALGMVCTGVAYLLYFRLIRDVGPMRALTVTFLIPVFAALWGALFLHEPIGLQKAFGGAVVLLGTAVTNGLAPLPALGRAGEEKGKRA